MRKVIVLALYITIIFGCSSNKKFRASGDYEVKSKTLGDRLFLHKLKAKSRIIGSSLNLTPDSTFLYITCGNQMTGHWLQVSDSMLLYVITNVYRSDSLKSSNAQIPDEPLIFHIRKAQLYRIFASSGSDKSVELLKKKN